MLLFPLALAQEAPTFDLSLQLRPRMEFRSYQAADPDAIAFVISERARLGLSLKWGPVITFAQVQDVRTWGEEADTLKDFSADGFDLHQGWLLWKVVPGLRLQVGRQEIAWEEQRLIGAVDWTQQGRSFDAVHLLAGKEESPWSAEAFVSVLGEKEAASALWAKDAWLGGLRGGWSQKKAMVDLLYLMDTDGTTERFRHTAGLYAKGGVGPVFGRVEGYVQVGNVGDANIFAYMVGVQGTFAPDVALQPQVSLWYDLLSGDAKPTDSTLGAFSTLYATNHKFYGTMDITCFTVGCSADGQGLHDAALKLQLGPPKKWSVNLDAHLFALPAPLAGQETILGEEVDLWGGVALRPGLGLKGGGSVFLRSGGADPEGWGWLMLDANLDTGKKD
ncbi:MAG TPA: alginate export family protein [Myxococcota bacterium]|nr:alginate export family protein [Myxococcota bacterium]